MVGEWTYIRTGAHDYGIVSDVRRRGEKITRLINVYDQKGTQSGERQAQKANGQRDIRQGGTVLAGDSNCNSTRLDLGCQVQRTVAFWHDVSNENGLEIGNDGRARHYWTLEDH